MIEVRVQDDFYVVTLSKMALVLTKQQFIQALRQGKWWKRRHVPPGQGHKHLKGDVDEWRTRAS